MPSLSVNLRPEPEAEVPDLTTSVDDILTLFPDSNICVDVNGQLEMIGMEGIPLVYDQTESLEGPAAGVETWTAMDEDIMEGNYNTQDGFMI